MAISDAYVLVCCDVCDHDEEVELPFTYATITGGDGRYDHDERGIARRLASKGWVFRDGKHFCSPECDEWTEMG